MVLCFHFLTSQLLNIGMFPAIMVLGATLFFDASWPRWFLRSAGKLPPQVQRASVSRLPRLGLVAALAFATLQLALPLRRLAYSGSTLWHEQGMRFAWMVVVREKNGSVSYRVRTRDRERERVVVPTGYLTRRQAREMATQPDLIVQLARHIAHDFQARGYRDVEVRADAFVSLNGRRQARLIDPDMNLARVPEGLRQARYILPPPTDAPISLKPVAWCDAHDCSLSLR